MANPNISTQVPMASNDVPVWALSPIGPAATAQTIDNTKIYTFIVPAGTLVRLSCSQNLYVRTRNADGAGAGSVAAQQQCGFLKSGAAWIIRSMGAIDVCTDNSTTVSWAPGQLVGTETDD